MSETSRNQDEKRASRSPRSRRSRSRSSSSSSCSCPTASSSSTCSRSSRSSRSSRRKRSCASSSSVRVFSKRFYERREERVLPVFARAIRDISEQATLDRQRRQRRPPPPPPPPRATRPGSRSRSSVSLGSRSPSPNCPSERFRQAFAIKKRDRFESRPLSSRRGRQRRWPARRPSPDPAVRRVSRAVTSAADNVRLEMDSMAEAALKRLRENQQKALAMSVTAGVRFVTGGFL